MQVIKRDGNIVEFDINKIHSAISRACHEVGYSDDLITHILGEFDEEFHPTEEQLSVEWIQDYVEQFLMEYEYYDPAKAYIIYRYNHNILRKDSNSLVKSITKKLMANDVVNQNANVDEYSFGGRIGEASRVVTKEYALQNCMSKMARKNHENNEIYIHDLDSYSIGMHNCLSIPFDKLLAKGFTTRQADVRPANSISTACQLIAVIFQIQSLQQFGGVSATHLDWTLEPYVKKSYEKYLKVAYKWVDRNLSPEDYAKEMTIKEIHQGIEGLIHNLK